MAQKQKLTSTVALVLMILFFVGLLSVSQATETDIRCLKSIKSSLEDPDGSLATWNFNNNNTTEGFICRFAGVQCWHPDENKVLNLRLSGFGLKGHFPSGLQYCTSLTNLDLSDNKISGTIPSDIANLIPYVAFLDLSSNNFSGQIPNGISKCNYLNLLNLDHNRLTGNLPAELALLSRIKSFDVSNNLLWGSVPNFGSAVVVYMKVSSFQNNPHLCGGPLTPCFTNNHNHNHNHKWFHNPFRLGFGIGYLISFPLALLCFFVSSLQLEPKSVMTALVDVIFTVQNKSRRKHGDQLLQFPTLKDINKTPQLQKLVNKMSFEELCKAMKNFSDANVIGIGKTGTMYKATLPNGWFLAVKRLHDPEQFEGQFVSELLALSRMRHDNLIPLLGFCIENNERLLVYKYMSNGSLYDCLHGEAKLLQWPHRVKIAAGVARGLAWLHHKSIFRVVHRDISSKSVLLDRFLEAKISNFGSAIVSNHGGEMFVYANESDHSGMLVSSEDWELEFVKKDVYDFGMVLLELITGRETISTPCGTSLHKTLVEWTSHVWSRTWEFNNTIDKHLMGQGFDREISRLLLIASDCVNPVAYERPTMLKVYERVSNIGERYGIPCDYGLLLQPRRS